MQSAFPATLCIYNIGKTVYDDLRTLVTIVEDSGLDWTIVCGRRSCSTPIASPTTSPGWLRP